MTTEMHRTALLVLVSITAVASQSECFIWTHTLAGYPTTHFQTAQRIIHAVAMDTVWIMRMATGNAHVNTGGMGHFVIHVSF